MQLNHRPTAERDSLALVASLKKLVADQGTVIGELRQHLHDAQQTAEQAVRDFDGACYRLALADGVSVAARLAREDAEATCRGAAMALKLAVQRVLDRQLWRGFPVVGAVPQCPYGCQLVRWVLLVWTDYTRDVLVFGRQLLHALHTAGWVGSIPEAVVFAAELAERDLVERLAWAHTADAEEIRDEACSA